MNPDALELLIDRVLSGQGDARSHAELEARLTSDPEAFDLYCRCCALHSALGRLDPCALDAEIVDALRVKAARSVRVQRWRRVAAAAAAAILLAGLWASVGPSREVLASFRASDDAEVRVERRGLLPSFRDGLARGDRLRVSQGSAILELPGGSSAHLTEGSEIEIVSAQQVRHLAGSASWHVASSTRHLDLETPGLWVSTREGDFQIEVPVGSPGQVAVSSGRVVVRERGKPGTATSRILGSADSYPPRDASPTSGPGPGTTAPATTPRWVRWSFDEPKDGAWPSDGDGGLATSFYPVSGNVPAQIAGVRGAGLRFERGQFLRAPWPGQVEERPITFTGWIRFDSPDDLPQECASFFFLGNETATRPMMWWGIGIHPHVFQGKPGDPGSGSAPTRWTHFAGVLHGNERTRTIDRVQLYVDGRKITDLHLTSDLPASAENNVARLGNLNFGFDLDEWTIIERGLSPEEITRLANRERWPLK